jgi:hypothetical protein
MDKIEKLELKNDLITLEVDRIVMKINEIIDYLNQSQKQPEGEFPGKGLLPSGENFK